MKAFLFHMLESYYHKNTGFNRAKHYTSKSEHVIYFAHIDYLEKLKIKFGNFICHPVVFYFYSLVIPKITT